MPDLLASARLRPPLRRRPVVARTRTNCRPPPRGTCGAGVTGRRSHGSMT